MIAVSLRARVAAFAISLVAACGTVAPPPRTAPAVVEGGAPAGAHGVVFDLEAAERFFAWIDGKGQDPLDWKGQRVSLLVRDWAKGNALSNPDEEIERQLTEVARAGPTDPRIVSARRLLAGVDLRKGEFLATVPAHLEAFLPRGTSIRARIVPSVFVPTFAFSDGENIVISLTSQYWKEHPGKVLNLLVHEIFHNGFATHQRGDALADVGSTQAFVGNIQWQIQNEGMATYVAYRGPRFGATVEDYLLLDDEAEVALRFALVRALLGEASSAGPSAALKGRVWEDGVKRRSFYVVGAHMARRIDEVRGRDALVGTISAGPKAFIDAYEATSPADRLRLPVSL